MEDTKYNVQLKELCELLNLGNVISEPTVVTGGFLHKMYAVETTKGRYAVKALNPQIMRRPNVMRNKINSEKIATLLAKKIPALAAMRVNDNVVHCLNEQYYMVFNWVNGVSIEVDDINPEYCRIIGEILAKIHSTDFSELGIIKNVSIDRQVIDWNYYLSKANADNTVWTTYMSENIESLYLWNKHTIASDKVLQANMVISHRDMDSKNVLWDNGKPIIIDWESAGYVNPIQELIEVLMYWSEDSKGNLNKVKFTSLLNGYKNIKEVNNVEWNVALHSGYLSKLEWLEYSLKRSLGIECTDKEEQELGSNQVIATIDGLISYSKLIPIIEEWLIN